ncbi:MAG: DNA polymerase III subunit delta' [Anaerolineae bacterium]|nr:DNA polymerase III subunit delta' [Anaerolineae bacterium]
MEDTSSRWGIIGHQWAVALLERSVALGQLAHAYLFLGPPRVGKTTLAIALAMAVNCEASQRPCRECRTCRLIAAGRHPDVRLIEGGEVRAIHIAQVREVQHELGLSPVEARRRVVIFTDFQGATPEAANCLLKTLEEPPGQAVLILTASQQGRLLPTIVSRCQRLALRPPSGPTIEQGLVAHYGADPDLARRLARLAAGRVGWAVQAVGDEALLERREEQLHCLEQVLSASRLGRLRWARDLSEEEEELPALLDTWLAWWRDLLLARVGCSDLVDNVDRRGTLEAEAARRSVPKLVSALRALSATRRRLESNANPRLALEVLFLSLD